MTKNHPSIRLFLIINLSIHLFSCQNTNLNSLEALPSQITLKNEKIESLEEKAYTAEQRWEWEYDMLKDPMTGLIPAKDIVLSNAQAKEAPVFDLLENNPNISINPRGPNNLGGRTRSIAFDTRDASIMLAGGVSSGLFRSTNGGNSWTKVSSNSEIHNVTTIAQDTRVGQEDTWYYGTGEASGNSAGLGAAYRGHGLWKSTNNGLSWTLLGSTQSSYTVFDIAFDYTNRLIVNPTNGDVYAAASDVILRSTDGGANWSIVLGSFGNNNYTDVVITSTGRLYAAFHGSDDSDGVHTSTDGTTWTKIAGSGAGTNHANWNAQSAYGRVVLAVAPSNEDKLFALYYNNATSNCSGSATPEAELFVWSQSGSSWTDLSANLPDESGCSNGNDPFACQGGYDLCIAVKPDDENTVFIGGTNAYRSTDGWTTTSNYDRIGGYASSAGYAQYSNHHPDIHTFVFAPGDDDNLYSGSDGGIARADITASSGTVSWTELNSDYVTYQYYHVDIEPSSGNDNVIGGAQDNGTTIIPSGSTASEIFGGDGVAVGLISATNATTFHCVLGFQNGGIYRTKMVNGSWTVIANIKPATAGTGIFVTYFHLDQDNTDILYYASDDKLYRTRITSSITDGTVTGDASTGWEEMTGIASTLSSDIRSIGLSRNNAYGGASYTSSNSDRKIYIGTSDGSLYRLNDPAYVSESTNPTSITPGTSGAGIVSSISVRSDDQDEVMATWSNYGINSCFHTSDASVASPSWSNIEGNLSAQSFRSCIIAAGNSQTIYLAGTENGLYCTNTLNGSSTSWSSVGSTSIGYAVCSSMRYRPSDYNVILGTHGNGMFQLDVSGAILPVELIIFNAKAQEKGNLLNWSTSSEITNDYFQIEHSLDGVYFEEVSRVNGSSESFNRLDYSFLHREAKTGLNYYRLSQIDLDGRTTDLGIKVVERKATISLVIEQNPVNETLKLRIEYPSEQDGKIDIFNLNGQLLFSENILIQKGLVNFQFNVTEFPIGNYFLRIQIGGEQYTERFVKIK
jgi:hypothetical protein